MTDTTLQVLFPTGKELNIRDVNLTIKPFKFGELSKVFKVIDPIFGALTSAMAARTNQFEMMSKLIADSGDNVIDLMVIGTKQPRAWLEDLDIDEGVELFTAVLEVNADFFVRRVLPQLNHKMETLAVPGLTQ